jgi:hypothetical protein
MIFRRAGQEPLTAPVRDPTGCLGEKKALFRHQSGEPALAVIPRQGSEVTGRIVAEEREMKAVLALRLAVARAGVASQPSQDGNNVLGEFPRAGQTRFQSDLDAGDTVRHPRPDGDDPVADRLHVSLGLDGGQS